MTELKSTKVRVESAGQSPDLLNQRLKMTEVCDLESLVHVEQMYVPLIAKKKKRLIAYDHQFL